MRDEFWDRPEVVDQFAARDPDHRLLQMIADYSQPERVRVLDLGCAGGRNTVLLAERGFDVWAIDASPAMVNRTRERLRPILGEGEADRRVMEGSILNLSAAADESVDLVIALGIYHNARTREEWEQAIGETARVLRRGGRVLVNHFTPEVDLTGDGVRRVSGEIGVYDGFPGGRAVLLETHELDEAMARHGFSAEVPSRTVRVELEKGRRVSTNALYCKQGEGSGGTALRTRVATRSAIRSDANPHSTPSP